MLNLIWKLFLCNKIATLQVLACEAQFEDLRRTQKLIFDQYLNKCAHENITLSQYMLPTHVAPFNRKINDKHGSFNHSRNIACMSDVNVTTMGTDSYFPLPFQWYSNKISPFQITKRFRNENTSSQGRRRNQIDWLVAAFDRLSPKPWALIIYWI